LHAFEETRWFWLTNTMFWLRCIRACVLITKWVVCGKAILCRLCFSGLVL